VFFKDDGGNVPLLDWLHRIPRKAAAKCIVAIERLHQMGHELRRPEADLLRDGIYELRIGLQGIHYRMLYFFDGKTTIVLSHGLTKERVVPPGEIDLAIRRRMAFLANPRRHTFEKD
jgi:phage-related protein